MAAPPYRVVTVPELVEVSVHGGALIDVDASLGLLSTVLPPLDEPMLDDVALDESVPAALELPDEVSPPFDAFDAELSERGGVGLPPQAAAAVRKEKAQNVRLVFMVVAERQGLAKLGETGTRRSGRSLANPTKRCSYSACE